LLLLAAGGAPCAEGKPLVECLVLFGSAGIVGAGRQPTHRGSRLLSTLPRLELLEADASLTSSVPVPENVPVVRHSKKHGEGYGPKAPFFPKAVHIKKSGLTWQEVPPVSTTMRCVLALIGQFFLLYAVRCVLMMVNRLKWVERKREERAWESVVHSVFFVPMLCVLFLAARLQALQLSRGEPEDFGLPQWWVKCAMLVCPWAVLVAGFAEVGAALFTRYQEDADRQRHRSDKVSKIIWYFRMSPVAVIYLAFTLVCLGTCSMQQPGQLWDLGARSQVSPAVGCTVFLTVMYFGVYLGIACVSLANEQELLGQRLRFCPALEYLKSAKETIVHSQMLCALFLTCQVRALQHDPLNGHPEQLVYTPFYVCSACIVLHTAVAVLSTFVDFREQQGDQAPRPRERKLLEVLGLVLMTLLCAFALVILVSMYGIRTPTGKQRMPSPWSLHCITFLTVLYFAVSWVQLTLPLAQRAGLVRAAHRSSEPSGLEAFLAGHAKEQSAICPKLSILILGTMMRAAQLTKGHGAPQLWCQVFQCIATVCILLQTVVRIDVMMQEPGKWFIVCTVVQYACLALMYVCALAIVFALFLLTPGNARGPGAFNISD